MPISETCKTFANDREAKAFMLGYIVGEQPSTIAGFDDSEPHTILLDFHKEDEESEYLDAARTMDFQSTEDLMTVFRDLLAIAKSKHLPQAGGILHNGHTFESVIARADQLLELL